MRITITTVDHAPDELYEQTPFRAVLIRELPGPDRPDYWLAALPRPLRWLSGGREVSVTHVVLAARWQGTRIGRRMWCLLVKLLYVVDDSVLNDAILDYGKCAYVAIGTANAAGALRRALSRWLWQWAHDRLAAAGVCKR